MLLPPGPIFARRPGNHCGGLFASVENLDRQPRKREPQNPLSHRAQPKNFSGTQAPKPLSSPETPLTSPRGDFLELHSIQKKGLQSGLARVFGESREGVVVYTYYNDNRLHTVTYEGLLFVYTYDLAGRLESITYPASTGIVANFTWNPNGQLLTLVYLQGGSPLQSFEYSYDDSGNRIQMIETPLNPLDAITWDYDYDWLDRLERVTRKGVLTSVYGYDESDNRISLDLPVSTEAWTYQVDLADQLQSRSVSIGGGPATVVETFVPDLDGNMESRTAGAVTTDYVWNTLNQKVKRTVNGTPQERTSYDGEGIRRLQKDGGANTKFYSAGATSLADTRPTGPVSFIQGSMLLSVEASGAISFYLADGLGSVRLIVDGTGAVVATFSADEFGVPESATGPAELQAHSYTGALGVRNDTALSGLLYMRQRYYDPQLGRFLSQDPIGFAGSLNLFGYVNQNPINLVDPEGLEPKGTVIVNFGKVKRPVPTLPWKERRTQGLTSEDSKAYVDQGQAKNKGNIIHIDDKEKTYRINCAGEAFGVPNWLDTDALPGILNDLLKKGLIYPVWGKPKSGDKVIYGSINPDGTMNYFHHIGTVTSDVSPPLIKSKMGPVPGLFYHSPLALPDFGGYSRNPDHIYIRLPRP